MNYDRTEGVTCLEIIILIAVVILAYFLLFGAPADNTSKVSAPSGGLMGSLASATTNVLYIDGTSYGLQAVPGDLFGVDIMPEKEVSGVLGAASIPFSLRAAQIQTVDFDNLAMYAEYNGEKIELTYSDERPLKSSLWTIAKKESKIPFKTADGDQILEGEEIFTVVISLPFTVPGGETFRYMLISKDGGDIDYRYGVPKEIISHKTVVLLG